MSEEKTAIRNPFIIPGIQKLQIDPQLKPDNTFENFIEGDCNRLARSAGYAVAQNPGGTAFNPLMIYGNSGLGKTHLAQAIGIEVKERYPDKTVLYVNANKFQTQFTEATRNNNRNDFLNFYQMIDVLILDDVQEFAGKAENAVADLFSYGQFDPDHVFAWQSVHHLVMLLIGLTLVAVLSRLLKDNFGFQLGDRKKGIRYFIIFTAVLTIISLIYHIIQYTCGRPRPMISR